MVYCEVRRRRGNLYEEEAEIWQREAGLCDEEWEGDSGSCLAKESLGALRESFLRSAKGRKKKGL
jgi:hypothetical protein